MANSSEDLSDRNETKRKVKFNNKKELMYSSSDEDDVDLPTLIPSTPLVVHTNTVNANTTTTVALVSKSRGINRIASNASQIAPNLTHRHRKSKKSANWELMEGLREGTNIKITKPEKIEGILLKRRTWPMKGWHKRYFILNDGIMTYAKSKNDFLRNKKLASINVYLSMVAFLVEARRILIDSSSSVWQIKTKTQPEFDQWLEQIKQHRLYNQHRLSAQKAVTTAQLPSTPGIAGSAVVGSASTANIISHNRDNSGSNLDYNMMLLKGNDQIDSVSGSVINVKVGNNEKQGEQNIEMTLKDAEFNLENLARLMNMMSTTSSSSSNSTTMDFLSVNNTKMQVSKSNPNLINDTIGSSTQSATSAQNPSLNVIPNNSSLAASDDAKIKANFYQGAKAIYDQLSLVHRQLEIKHEKLVNMSNNSSSSMSAGPLQSTQRSQSILSSISLQDSQLQFYDAIESLTSDSESDEDIDDSEAEESNNISVNNTNATAVKKRQSNPLVVPELLAQTVFKRRRVLPATSPDTSQVSILGILRKAIGKDLSKISLPVILNEPLSILQRLCEEVEYSDLLDTANSIQDPFDRMVYVAAFIISGYSSSYYRNGSKNFNPLLGETFELFRPDKGWKYVAEQVSHHPPISATHCQSKNFIHEQVFHARVKFWGRSMEVHPEGFTRLTLPKFNETYQWNKIVTYVYNITSAQRRVEYCGEITVKCTNGVSCTITFPKSGYCGQKNEFYGDIIYENMVKRKVFGQWHEAFMYGADNTAKTIWRMGAMPENAHLYYGFTRFAMELNELTEDIKDFLPVTDSRFRPDERYLEEGNVDKAESEKMRIEEMQRSRRRIMDQRNEHHAPMWFTRNLELNEWEFNNQYWIKRENPGFSKMKDQMMKLW